MADDLERASTLTRTLTPAMRDAVSQKLASGTLPTALQAALSTSATDAVSTGASPLESMVPLAPIAALEAIVRLTGRPPMMVQNDQVVMEPLPDFPIGTDLQIRNVQKWIPSVGRIEFLNASMQWGGTGSVIDTRANGSLVVTNRHVAKLVAKRMADGTGVFLRNDAGVRCGANIDFREEQGSVPNDASHTAALTAIDYIADDLAADVALLRITTASFALPTPLHLADQEAAIGALVALIGYPAFDPRNDADVQARYFHDIYNVKRFAPGRVIQALTAATTLSHDCTSLGGNSGSPLVLLDTGAMVGLHFSGVYGQGNSAVGVGTLKALLAGSTTTVQVPGAGPSESLADGVHQAEHFAGRTGFTPAFLLNGKVATPWPKLSPAATAKLAQPSDHPPEPGELRYTHFGVKFSAADKLPLVTAVNIDGAHSVRIKRAPDKWFVDMRISPERQLGSKNYADPEIDRGHMVRREDPNWGTTAIAQLANDDTFHYVNAAPQHSLLNQGKTLWAGLEDYILDSARTSGFRASVFTGPILGEDDDTIDGARVPLEFWKVVATLDQTGTKLRATAYLLSQGQLIRDLLEKRARTEAVEGIVLGAYRTFQIAIADLADATGYDFSPYAAADPLAPPTTEGVADAAPRFVPIDDLSSIVL